MADLDLLDLLSADHENLLSARDRPRVADIAQHLSVERDLLYPAIHDCGDRGEGTLRSLRRSERMLEERMADFEGDPSAEHRDRLMAAVGEHVDFQQEMFGELRRMLPSSRLVAALDTVPLSIGGSPTHAHASLAEGGALGEMIEDVASVSDHVRDHLHHSAQD